MNRSQWADYPKTKPRDDKAKPRVQIVCQQSPPSKSGVKKWLPKNLAYIYLYLYGIHHRWCWYICPDKQQSKQTKPSKSLAYPKVKATFVRRKLVPENMGISRQAAYMAVTLPFITFALKLKTKRAGRLFMRNQKASSNRIKECSRDCKEIVSPTGHKAPLTSHPSADTQYLAVGAILCGGQHEAKQVSDRYTPSWQS